MENVEIAGIAGTKISSRSTTKNTNSKKGGDYMSSPFFVNKKLKVLPLDTYQKIPITKGKTFTKFKKKFDITNQLKYSFPKLMDYLSAET
jgi:hypothetical protein